MNQRELNHRPGYLAEPIKTDCREIIGLIASSIFPFGKEGRCRVGNVTIFMCRMSGNLGASTSWNPHGLYRVCFSSVFRSCSKQVSKNI
jgi:hypothetical protein